MAITFSSAECRQAAADLTQSANTLNTILNTNLQEIIRTTKNNYSSDAANQVYAVYDKMQAQFGDFIGAINSCSKELTERVAPYIENVEKAAAEKVQ